MSLTLRSLGYVERLFEEGNRRYAGWLMVRAVLLSGHCETDRLREAADRATASISRLGRYVGRSLERLTMAAHFGRHCFVSPLLTAAQMDEYREHFLTELNTFGSPA